MKRYLIAGLLLAVAFAASAGDTASNTLPNEHVTSAPGACHTATNNDTRLTWSTLGVNNTSSVNTNVLCSPAIDVSQQGTNAFGAVITNRTASTVVIACAATISSGGNGPRTIARSVMVGPNTSARIAWVAADMGYNKVLVGGQAGLLCTLKPKTALSWVWTTSVAN
jgi:hypothetical protein